MFHWTNERDAQLVELRSRGLEFGDIAEEMGEGLTTASCLGRYHRLQKTKFPSQIQREQENKSAADERIARRLATDTQALAKLRERLAQGWEMKNAVRAAVRSGCSQKAIAQYLNMSASRVSSIARQS